MGSARKDLVEFPEDVRREIGYALYLAQEGKTYYKAKPLKGFDVAVTEIISDFNTDTYRAVYTVKINADIYVLHAFQKKSKSGIQTPKHDIEVIRKRLQQALKMSKGTK